MINFFHRIKKFWLWRKIIWNDFDFDFSYSIGKILEFKLGRVLNGIHWDGFSIPYLPFGIARYDKDGYCDEPDYIDGTWAKRYCEIALACIKKYNEDDDNIKHFDLALEIIKKRSHYWWD